ncbi:hypothetical protein BGZ70_010031 [Mortierella alpina]|uniref:Alginate lyase domain-containing protein n=1 Tax=Mortierella alpina TaxID=64518 RepID=A0A9P6J073_MORAP|nr:hypothetical protein BGZ70_010031 [Mortierella alpina]
MVALLRGTSKRAMTIVLGLCVFCIVLILTPNSSRDLTHTPSSWRNSKTPFTEQEQDLLRQEQDRQRLANERHRKEQQQILQQEKEAEERREQELEEERLKDEQQQERKEINEVHNSDEVPSKDPTFTDKDAHDEDELLDDLPTAFDESLFPPSSQKTLEAKIGVKTLDDYLNQTPQNREARSAAVAYALRQANIAYRNNTVYSVVIKPKSKIPPSGDIHDYTSLARYFWKNPNTADGLPYVRLDGKPNPDMDSVWDYRLLRKVFRDCYYMGQAYFWTGDERYAEKVIYRVKQWFLDPETRMNPNIKYGSLIFGNDLGRAQGVLDMFKVYGMFDALKAIEGSEAMRAEPTLISDLQTWFTSYMVWLDHSIQANQEKNAHNNHGTYFTVQYLSILEFLGRDTEAKALAEESRTVRVGPQIRKDGAQPHETIRPISYFYSTFNLQGLILLAMQADSHGVDLWHHRGPVTTGLIRVNSKKSVEIEVGGGTIEDAILYLADYGVKDLSEWPYPDSGTRSLSDVLKMARVASLIYGRDRWQEPIENLEAKIDEAIPGEGSSEGGEEGDSTATTTTTETKDGVATTRAAVATDDGDPNGFMCELGILSKGTLWHCYK